MSEKCAGCDKPVYFAEKVMAMKLPWHRPCFKCAKCSKTIEIGKHTEHDKKPYCSNCYKMHFGPKGYGSGGMSYEKD